MVGQESVSSLMYPKIDALQITSIVGLVVEFVVAIDEARVRFTDDALSFSFFFFFFLTCSPFHTHFLFPVLIYSRWFRFT